MVHLDKADLEQMTDDYLQSLEPERLVAVAKNLRVTCIWLMIAVIYTGSVNLSKWVVYQPCRRKFAQSIQRRIQRWLYNPTHQYPSTL